MQDVQFWKGSHLLSLSASFNILAVATAATFTLLNQENGVWGGVIHLNSTGLSSCPILSLAHWYSQIASLSLDPITLLSLYTLEKCDFHVTSADITKMVQGAVVALDLESCGFTLS